MSTPTREQMRAERQRLDAAYRVAFDVLKATPEWVAFNAAHVDLVEHIVLYGKVGVTDPVGILSRRDDP